MMFKIYDGREHFYQWDLDRKLIVEDDSVNQVHFCNKTGDSSFVVEVYELEGQRVVDVPNILLQNEWRICVYAYDKNYTKHMARFDIVARTKPQSYVYTETEVLNYNTLLERIDDIDNDIEGVVKEYLEENPIEVDVDLENYYTKEEANKAIDDAVGAIELKEGPQGPQGIQGPAGPAGADGKDGKDGADGANGKDGINGKDGANGADGYTPIKGTDYWTEDDKAAMVADVIAALPVYNGEVV
jgi:hypothetical protein